MRTPALTWWWPDSFEGRKQSGPESKMILFFSWCLQTLSVARLIWCLQTSSLRVAKFLMGPSTVSLSQIAFEQRIIFFNFVIYIYIETEKLVILLSAFFLYDVNGQPAFCLFKKTWTVIDAHALQSTRDMHSSNTHEVGFTHMGWGLQCVDSTYVFWRSVYIVHL